MEYKLGTNTLHVNDLSAEERLLLQKRVMAEAEGELCQYKAAELQYIFTDILVW
ncbi:hypothetical protein ACOZB4_23655 [Paenibacillus sp. NPDC058898]|uniref:hypothetical protein n=1 Tax=Paenibacillus sp. NPDC058898 TaxID=3346669 RepID=UPI003BF4EA5F